MPGRRIANTEELHEVAIALGRKLSVGEYLLCNSGVYIKGEFISNQITSPCWRPYYGPELTGTDRLVIMEAMNPGSSIKSIRLVLTEVMVDQHNGVPILAKHLEVFSSTGNGPYWHREEQV